ncbi:AAA family ATPase [Cellulomonas composti]|uniref:ATPase AAA n=1 Tax=Cellulomonas composti TaxID=266130 RepID=A0A511JAN6_9CELL|nr:ATP-binding protein [Cellulomonas composti]GEL95060.1 ATPase AAA [Cellulomonas composti]
MPTTAQRVRTAFDDALARREALPSWAPAATARAARDAWFADADAFGAAEAALDEVAGLFGLGPAEAALVGVAHVVEQHPSAHVLVGVLAGDEGAARPTVALAFEIAGLSLADPVARARLGEGARLVRSGLLVVDGDGPLPARRLRLHERAAMRLLGEAGPLAPALDRLVLPASPADVPGTAAVAAALRAGEPLVWVHSPLGTVGTAMAVAACQELDVDVLVADLERQPSTPGVLPDPLVVRGVLRDLVLEAGLQGAVLVLGGAHLAGPLVQELDRAVVPVVAVGRTAWDAHWAAELPATVAAGRLTSGDRSALWDARLGAGVVGRDVTALRLSPEQVAVVARRALADAELADEDTPSGPTLRAAARRLSAGGSAGARASAGTGSGASLDDLVLPARTRLEVERLVGWVRDRDDVLALGDLHGKGGKGTGISALFSGSPGTGKTLAAHVVADSLGADLFQVDLSAVVDKYIGETEKNLERVFGQAESLGAVLFFDEADSLFGSRSAVNDARDRYANQEVSYLLQRMEASEGVTILATNLRGNLDPAFARRLHFMVHFPDPDEETRTRLWRHHLGQLPRTDPDDPVDVDLLAACLELAGGDIRNIVLAAAYDAVAQRKDVGMNEVRAAANREMAKLGRRVGDTRWTV